MHIPTTRTKNPMSWRKWKTCQPMPRDTPQMTRVLTESRTIRVVALISLVTEMPAKLKKAIDTIVIKNAPDREKVLESQSPNLRFTSQWDEWMIVQPTLLQRQIIYEIIYESRLTYLLAEGCEWADRGHRKRPPRRASGCERWPVPREWSTWGWGVWPGWGTQKCPPTQQLSADERCIWK